MVVFLSMSIVTANPIAIAMIMAAPMPRMYISICGVAVIGCWVVVGCGAGSTANELTACDGQYDSEPAKEA